LGNAISVKNLNHFYIKGDKKINSLNNVEFDVMEGEIVSFLGEDGSGKSTLLNILRGSTRPTSGVIKILNEDINLFKEYELTYFMQSKIGYLGNEVKLLPSMTIGENVEYPLEIFGEKRATRKLKVEETLKSVGMKDMGNNCINKLSSGERLRVELAMALVMNPKIILVDEPSYILKDGERDKIFEMFKDINKNKKVTFVMASKDEGIRKICDRVVRIDEGTIRSE
jgi:ABC-type lipoprotein export system ATPase subunit